jgi:hypothetical protein
MSTTAGRLPMHRAPPAPQAGFNWRRPLIRAAFHFQHPHVLPELDLIAAIERSPEKIDAQGPFAHPSSVHMAHARSARRLANAVPVRGTI